VTDKDGQDSAPPREVAIAEEDREKLPPFVRNLAPAIQAQVLKALRLREEGKVLYPNDKKPIDRAQDLREELGEKSSEELEELYKTSGDRVVAGRIMARRDHGKTTFFSLMDSPGRIQLYIRHDKANPLYWETAKALDIGDIVWTKGKLFKTKTGELTIHVEEIRLMSKALWPLPEKYHTLGVEMRQRRRYLDLIMSPESRRIFRLRRQIIDYIRKFLNDKGFVEVETPMLHPIPGGASAQPFKTHYNALDQDYYLRVAPELYLKRLLVGGMDKVYELNRNFRNEGLSIKHNPEFTMLEFYQVYSTYEDLMVLTEELLEGLVKDIWVGNVVTYQEEKISFQAPFRRLSFKDSLSVVGGAPEEVKTDIVAARNYLRTIASPDFDSEEKLSLPELQEEIFDIKVEKELKSPTFITSYPTEISPLARKNDKDPTVTDRFELFICGREIANAFSELNDPLDQYERFLAQAREKDPIHPEDSEFLDRDYVRALMYGMPPAAGEGIGIDRLVMLLTDAPTIKDVIFFPQLRSEPEFS
jgi:lysyl-tRNA synthetase class 2